MRVRRLRPLVASSLAALPPHPGGAGSSCRGWQALLDDDVWARASVSRFGLCGVAATEGDEVIAAALLAPSLQVPRSHPLGRSPGTADAAVLVAVHVDEAWRGIGIGRQLVQSASSRLLGAAACLETAGGIVGPDCRRPPAAWLRRVGFADDTRTDRLPPDTVRMRLDLDATARWRPDLRGAWELLSGWLPRPVASPVAAHRTGDSSPQ